MSKNSENKTGLFFGSFNPVHTGHLIIANYFIQYTDIENVRFIVSPQNPFKADESLLDEQTRLNLVRLATANNSSLVVSDIEFSLEQPSYTYNTLEKLFSQEPDKKFVMIIGSDNLQEFDRWKNYEKILEMVDVYIYPRPGFAKKTRFDDHPKVHHKSAPVMEISSSFIRKAIAGNKDPRYFLPENVYNEIMEKGYYKRLG